MSIKDNINRLFRRNFPVTWTKLHYKRLFNRKLDLKNPVGYNQKISWMKLYYCPHNELEIRCTDKYEVRSYVESKGLKDILNPIYGVWDSVDQINWDELPNKFALKCNHGCEMNIICEDKSSLDIENAKKQLGEWMRQDFGKERAQPHYSKIKPRIICEKYIEAENQSGGFPDDYKIHCFNGVPKVIDVHTGRGEKHICTSYDAEWNYHDYYNYEPRIEEKPPVCFDRLLEISRVLSKDFPYVRVDLYIDNEKIIFGEFTFTQGNGCLTVLNANGDCQMGQLLDLSPLMK